MQLFLGRNYRDPKWPWTANCVRCAYVLLLSASPPGRLTRFRASASVMPCSIARLTILCCMARSMVGGAPVFGRQHLRCVRSVRVGYWRAFRVLPTSVPCYTPSTRSALRRLLCPTLLALVLSQQRWIEKASIQAWPLYPQAELSLHLLLLPRQGAAHPYCF